MSASVRSRHVHTQKERGRALLRALERAAKANDLRSFMAAIEAVNWEICQPGDFIRAVDLALNVGAFAVAHDISEKGRRKYPNHPELRKHASILAPPKILRTNLPADATVEANERWLKKCGHEFRGRWIAVRDGEFLGSADTLAGLIANVGKTSGALLTLID
jgi:hypothetical protein